jgi:phage baseplate assembly protein W
MAGSEEAFLGTGWAFPIHVDGSGEIALVSGEEDIRQAVQIILGTALGERVMRPDFGAGLNRLVFEPVGASTLALVRVRVEQALVNWEPRIDQVSVSVTTEPQEGRLSIEIHYRVRATNIFYNLVYPFYLVEGEQT